MASAKIIQFPTVISPVNIVLLQELYQNEEWAEQDRKLEELLNSNLTDDEVIEKARELFKK
jgi:hypothetical protein